MTQFAHITSLDALKNFRAALVEFSESATLALSEAESDVQRTVWWIGHDQHSHWQREIKKRNDKLAQAKADLYRAQLNAQDMQTSAILERKAVQKWERAVGEAEEKLRRVKKWQQILERERMLFKAQCQQVASCAAGDFPVAVGRMDRMIDALEKYIALTPPESSNFRQAVSDIGQQALADLPRALAEQSRASAPGPAAPSGEAAAQ